MIRRPALWLVALGVLLLDQATKFWALHALDGGRSIDLAGEWFGLELVRNSGAALSLLGGTTWAVTIIMVIVTGGLVWYSRRATGTFALVLFGAALGGALGNLGDRLFREPSFGQGHVVDMIRYGDWFVGNVADIAIVGAAALAIVSSWLGAHLLETEGEPRRP